MLKIDHVRQNDGRSRAMACLNLEYTLKKIIITTAAILLLGCGKQPATDTTAQSTPSSGDQTAAQGAAQPSVETQQAGGIMREVIATDQAPKAIGPYSQAICSVSDLSPPLAAE